MDDTDMIILRLLNDHGRMSFTEIGEFLGMSRVAVKKRVRKLEASGVIRGYKAVIDPEVLADIEAVDVTVKDTFGGATMMDLDEKTAAEMNHYLDGITVQDIISERKDRFRFKVEFSRDEMANDIDALNLSPRAYNCLRRSSVNTIGDLINNYRGTPEETTRSQLKKIRNLGAKSIEEIMIKLFYYHFTTVPVSKRAEYMEQLLKDNQY